MSEEKSIVRRVTEMGLDAATSLPVSGTLDLLMTFAGKNNRRVEDATREMYEDLVLEVHQRVLALQEELEKQGETVAEMPDIVVTAVMKKLQEEGLNGGSPERLDAMINAAVRQFDPSFGTAAARRFWLDQLSELSDVEIFLLSNIANGPIVSDGRTHILYRVSLEYLKEAQAEPDTVYDHATPLFGKSYEETQAMNDGLGGLSARQLVQQRDLSQTVHPVVLSKKGKVLARLVSRPTG